MKPVKQHADNAKSYSNSEKVRICRLFLLAPVACLVVVLLLMLVCMEMVPGMQKEAPSGSETDCVVVSSRNCTVARSNTNESTDHASCSNSRSKSVQFEARCFKIVDWYTTEEAKERNRSVLSPDKRLRKTCSICLHNVSTQLLLEFKPKSYDGGRVTNSNNTSVVKNITGSRCVVMPEDRDFSLTPNGTCWTLKKSEVDRKKVVVSLVLVVLLFLGLICFLLMCVFTEKAMRVCCHLCYDDKV